MTTTARPPMRLILKQSPTGLSSVQGSKLISAGGEDLSGYVKSFQVSGEAGGVLEFALVLRGVVIEIVE